MSHFANTMLLIRFKPSFIHFSITIKQFTVAIKFIIIEVSYIFPIIIPLILAMTLENIFDPVTFIQRPISPHISAKTMLFTFSKGAGVLIARCQFLESFPVRFVIKPISRVNLTVNFDKLTKTICFVFWEISRIFISVLMQKFALTVHKVILPHPIINFSGFPPLNTLAMPN